MNEIMQIDSDWLWITLRGLLVLTGAFILIKMVRPPSEIHTEDGVMNFIKFLGYGALAGFIYITATNSGAKEIDVLTFFTFLLAIFEASHNFLLTGGASIAMFLRSIFISEYKGN